MEYHYEHLENPESSLRLLDIIPGSEDLDTITCQLTQEEIGTRPYHCLSYTWYPDTPEHTILINGMSMSIGHNLWLFLQAYRSAKMPHPLWVDALCINQSDAGVVEKNQQVKRMGEIYARSEKVLIWLGNLEHGVTEFLGEMVHVAEQYRSLLDHNQDTREGHTQYFIEDFSRTMFTRGTWLPERLSKFASIKYWSRVWIVQEIILAPSVAIFLGSKALDLDAFAGLVEEVNRTPVWYKELWGTNGYGDPDSTAANLLRWRHHRLLPRAGTHPQSPGLATVVPLFTTAGCRDSLDRVYAFLSLDRGTKDFVVDYKMSAEEVFRYTMDYLMEGKSLDHLLYLGISLLEALEIKPAREDIENREMGLYKRQKVGSIVLGNYTSMAPGGNPVSSAISSLVWSNAILANGPVIASNVPCVYHTVRDGRSTHVFEYAFKSLPSGRIVVAYARTFEYMYGSPITANNRQELAERFVWVSLASEQVWFTIGPSYEAADFDSEPEGSTDPEGSCCSSSSSGEESGDGEDSSDPEENGYFSSSSDPGGPERSRAGSHQTGAYNRYELWSWRSPRIELVDRPPQERHGPGLNRLRPAEREWPYEKPWDSGSQTGRPRFFLCIQNRVAKDIRKQLKRSNSDGPAWRRSDNRGGLRRSTTVRLEDVRIF